MNDRLLEKQNLKLCNKNSLLLALILTDPGFIFSFQELHTMRGPLELGDYDGLEDEAFPPLPPPQSPGQGGQDEGDPFGNGEKLFVTL